MIDSIFKYIIGRFAQNSVVNAANSSSTNITASFAGASASNLGYDGIRISLKTDVLTTVTVDQSIDGANFDHSISYTVALGIADTRTIKTVGSHFKVTVTNETGGTSTYFRLQTVLVPITNVTPPKPTLYQSYQITTAMFGTNIDIDVEGMTTLHLDYAGGMTGGSCDFAGSINGINFFQIEGTNSMTKAGTSVSILQVSDNPFTQLKFDVTAMKTFRIRTFVTAGTGLVNIGLSNSQSVGLVNQGTQNVWVMGTTDNSNPGYKYKAATFRTPGRAGTAGQKLMSIHNATGSTVTLTIKKITVDLMSTVVKAVGTAPPIVRIWKVTVLPTNGIPLTKIGEGSLLSSSSITVKGDASSDGVISPSALTATLPTGTFVAQEFAPRLITAVGYEAADRMEFITRDDSEIKLYALEGIVVFLDYSAAGQNPATDMWLASMEWTEE